MITRQRLVRSWWFFRQTPMEFRFRWDAEKISPMARPRKSCISWQVDFCQFRPILAQMCFGFLWANLFLWASTSHVQGSISNARGHLNQKSPLELPYKPKSWPKMWLGWPKKRPKFFCLFSYKGRFVCSQIRVVNAGSQTPVIHADGTNPRN